MTLYFKPIPPTKWIENLNRLKFIARQAGFEPILSIDVQSNDPSMRIQQSASFIFSSDIMFLFLKIPKDLRREFRNGVDVDHLIYKTAEELQENLKSPFTYKQFRQSLSNNLAEHDLQTLDAPREEGTILKLFNRYCDQVSPLTFLAKPITPFSDQIFDVPAQERLFTYVPIVIRELAANDQNFTYEAFLLKLAEYVENGTRMLINELSDIDMRSLIEIYAEPIGNGRSFQIRPLPELTAVINDIFQLDPYEFEKFVAHLLVSQGFTNVVIAGRSGDRGVDIIGNDPDGKPTVVQCKRYISNVGSEPIQRLHSFAVTRGATRRIVVTTSGFTPQAVEEASITRTELINGEQLERLVSTYLPDYFDKQN